VVPIELEHTEGRVLAGQFFKLMKTREIEFSLFCDRVAAGVAIAHRVAAEEQISDDDAERRVHRQFTEQMKKAQSYVEGEHVLTAALHVNARK
jgi:hypothetical protein